MQANTTDVLANRQAKRTEGHHMALRVVRGLFRLWLVLSVLWIGGVGVMTWPAFDPDAYLEGRPQPIRWSAAEAALLSFAPPAFMLALGSALVWAFRGFR